MADMSTWDRLAHWTFSSLENLVGTGQGTGTVFGPPKGATWADWRNNDNWAQPGEPGGRPVEYTGGGTADTGAPLDSRWVEVNPKSDMIMPGQQVYVGPGARQPDWPGARKPWIDPNTGRPWDPSVESGAPRPTWIDPNTGQPFNPGGGGGPAGGGQGFGGGRSHGAQQQGPHDRFSGGATSTGLGAPSTVTGQPWVDGGRMGIEGGDPFTEADNMPRSVQPSYRSGAGGWRNPNADPFPGRDPDNVTGINPAGKPRDPSWGMPQANPRWQEGGWDDQQPRIGGGSMRIMDYPQIKKDLEARKQMYLDMFGRGEIGHDELAREIESIEPEMQEVLHWEAQQAWDAQQRGLQAQLREKFEGWSAAQIREWFKNNPMHLGQGNPGFWNRYGKKQPGSPSSRNEFGPGVGPAAMGREDIIDIIEGTGVPLGGRVSATENPPRRGSTERVLISSDDIEARERQDAANRAATRAEVKAEADLRQTMSTAEGMQDVQIQNMIMDYADEVIAGGLTLDEVDEDFREWVKQEVARRKAALKRTGE